MDTENNDQSNDIQQTPQESEPVSVPQVPMVESELPSEQPGKQNSAKRLDFICGDFDFSARVGSLFGYRNGIARRLEKEKLLLSRLPLNNIS